MSWTTANVTLPLSEYEAEHFLLEVDGKVATVTLNRPERKNPLTFDSYSELGHMFRAAADDEDIKAFVIAGAGGNFSSGGDVFEIIGPLVEMDTSGLMRFTRMTGELVKAMLDRCIQVNGAHVLVMGLTFKENCPDLRNTRVIDVIRELQDYNVTVDVYDPWINPDEAHREYGIQPIEKPQTASYDGIVLAVAHDEFKAMPASEFRQLGRDPHVLYDLKYVLPKEAVDLRL